MAKWINSKVPVLRTVKIRLRIQITMISKTKLGERQAVVHSQTLVVMVKEMIKVVV